MPFMYTQNFLLNLMILHKQKHVPHCFHRSVLHTRPTTSNQLILTGVYNHTKPSWILPTAR